MKSIIGIISLLIGLLLILLPIEFEYSKYWMYLSIGIGGLLFLIGFIILIIRFGVLVIKFLKWAIKD